VNANAELAISTSSVAINKDLFIVTVFFLSQTSTRFFEIVNRGFFISCSERPRAISDVKLRHKLRQTGILPQVVIDCLWCNRPQQIAFDRFLLFFLVLSVYFFWLGRVLSRASRSFFVIVARWYSL
jgi:hypothetical protein